MFLFCVILKLTQITKITQITLRIVHQSTPAISNLPHGDSSKRRRKNALRVASHQFQRSNTNGSLRVRQGHRRAIGINLDGASLNPSIRSRR